MPAPRSSLLRRVAGRRLDIRVTLRRKTATLRAQPATIVSPTTRGVTQQGAATREAQGQAELWGLPTMNVRAGDRFTYGGALYTVVFVRPERDAATIADVEVVNTNA